jgi:hypothetical protein
MEPPLTPAVFFTLFSLSNGEKHGYAIMQETENLSGGKFRMGPRLKATRAGAITA